MATRAVFALTSGRSGTRFLCELLRRNARGCRVEHEPYFRPRNPTMFGLPIWDRQAGNLDAVRRLAAMKRDAVARCRAEVYIETSHAFLKSWWDLAPGLFPGLRLIRLVRHPLRVARSEANREALLHRWRVPCRHYRGRDGRRYFRWSLTGLEPIFGHFDVERLTLFQRYLIQWLEIENRAAAFLDRFDLHAACITLHAPRDLADPAAIEGLIRFLGLELAGGAVVIAGNRNRNPGRPTVVGEEEERECRKVVDALPDRYLEVFARAPHAGSEWSGLLRQ
jgi:hypothetical protein